MAQLLIGIVKHTHTNSGSPQRLQASERESDTKHNEWESILDTKPKAPLHAKRKKSD